MNGWMGVCGGWYRVCGAGGAGREEGRKGDRVVWWGGVVGWTGWVDGGSKKEPPKTVSPGVFGGFLRVRTFEAPLVEVVIAPKDTL